MLPMETLRGWQFIQMEDALDALTSLVQAHSEEALTTYRDGGIGWTVLQVLCHLRDFEAVFQKRMRLMLETDNPQLPFPDPDMLANENAYWSDDVYDVMQTLRKRRTDYLAFMKELDDEAWECVGQHPTRGAFTLHDQLFLNTHHDMVHMEQITRILAEKKG